LIGPSLRERLQVNAQRVLSPYWDQAAEALANRTAEQRANMLGRRVRLEAVRKPANQRMRHEAALQKGEAFHARYLAGEWRPAGPGPAALERRRQRLKDPEYRAWLGKRLSDAVGGRVSVACATCGTLIEIQRARARRNQRRFCGPACLRAFQQELGRLGAPGHVAMRADAGPRVCAQCGKRFIGTKRSQYCSRPCKSAAYQRSVTSTCAGCGQIFQGAPGQRTCSRSCGSRARGTGRLAEHGQVVTRLTERLHALDPTALAVLASRPREAVRLYYGLGEAARTTLAETAALLGCTVWETREALAEGIAQLLGPEAAGNAPRTCSACGQTFMPSGAWPERRTCSAACQRERRRQNGLANSPAARTDIRAKLSAVQKRRQWAAGEALRALGPTALAVLATRQQEIVVDYYGLDDAEPLTSGEIGTRLGVSADRVRQMVRQSVVRLLGPAAERVPGTGPGQAS
jgi:Sigma-70, region 4